MLATSESTQVVTNSYPRLFGKSIIEFCHSIPDSDGPGFHFKIAGCYANGFGAKRDRGSVLTSLGRLGGGSLKDRLLHRLQTELPEDYDPAVDSRWFSTSVLEYQQTAWTSYLETLESLSLPSSHRQLSPQEIYEELRNERLDVPAEVQIVARGGTYTQPLLHYAASANNIGLAILLIDRGCDVNSTDDERRTALFEACSFGHVQMASLLLDKGATAALEHDTGTSPLHLLMLFMPEDIPSMATKLLRAGARIVARTRPGLCWEIPWHGISLSGTPLHFAVGCRNSVAVEALLKLGADPNLRCPFWSSLDLAASLSQTEVCELLLQYGATATKHWFSGHSPLHCLGTSLYSSLQGKVRLLPGLTGIVCKIRRLNLAVDYARSWLSVFDQVYHRLDGITRRTG